MKQIKTIKFLVSMKVVLYLFVTISAQTVRTDFNSSLEWTASGDILWEQVASDTNLDGTPYALLQPITTSNNTKTGYLTSDPFDGSIFSAMMIEFDQVSLFSQSSGSVEYSTDGVNWNELYLIEVSSGAWGSPDSQSMEIPVFSQNMQIRFTGKLKGKSGSSWALDNIRIYDPTAPLQAPQNLQITVTGSDLTLTWDIVTEASSYDVYTSQDPYGVFTLSTNTASNHYSTSDVNTMAFWYVVAK